VDLRDSAFFSALIGIGLCAANVIIGVLIARYSFKKKFRKALSIVIGSMVARMALSLGTAGALIALAPIDVLAFSLAFGVGNFIFLFVEIIYFHIKMG